jgi:hypothetical protein
MRGLKQVLRQRTRKYCAREPASIAPENPQVLRQRIRKYCARECPAGRRAVASRNGASCRGQAIIAGSFLKKPRRSLAFVEIPLGTHSA